jgi:hypothetical protein
VGREDNQQDNKRSNQESASWFMNLRQKKVKTKEVGAKKKNLPIKYSSMFLVNILIPSIAINQHA